MNLPTPSRCKAKTFLSNVHCKTDITQGSCDAVFDKMAHIVISLKIGVNDKRIEEYKNLHSQRASILDVGLSKNLVFALPVKAASNHLKMASDY